LRLFTFICDSRPVARYVVLCMEACTGVFFSPEKKRRKRKRRNTGKTNLRDLPDSVMQGTPLAVLVLDTLLPSFHIMQYACMPVIYFILYVLFFLCNSWWLFNTSGMRWLGVPNQRKYSYKNRDLVSFLVSYNKRHANVYCALAGLLLVEHSTRIHGGKLPLARLSACSPLWSVR